MIFKFTSALVAFKNGFLTDPIDYVPETETRQPQVSISVVWPFPIFLPGENKTLDEFTSGNF